MATDHVQQAERLAEDARRLMQEGCPDASNQALSLCKKEIRALVAERDEARRERDSLVAVASGWALQAANAWKEATTVREQLRHLGPERGAAGETALDALVARCEAAEAALVEALNDINRWRGELVEARQEIGFKKKALRNCREAHLAAEAERDALAAALRAEIERVCECGGENDGIEAIDCERSSFDHGANAYDGSGNVITDYFDCPCAPLRAALARVSSSTQGNPPLAPFPRPPEKSL